MRYNRLHSSNYKLILRVISDGKGIFSVKRSEIEPTLSLFITSRAFGWTRDGETNNRRLNFQDSEANRIGRSYCDWICWHPCRTNDCRKVDQTVPQGWVDFVCEFAPIAEFVCFSPLLLRFNRVLFRSTLLRKSLNMNDKLCRMPFRFNQYLLFGSSVRRELFQQYFHCCRYMTL